MIEQLKRLREQWGWSQAFVAVMLRVAQSTISAWERGKAEPSTNNEQKMRLILEAVQAASRDGQPPEIEVIEEQTNIGGDAVQGDQTIHGSRIDGDQIITKEGATYVRVARGKVEIHHHHYHRA